MYAVIRTGGKQYRVKNGDILRVEKLDAEVGAEVSLDVLALGEGDDLVIGSPLVESADVKGTVIRHGRTRKEIVFKFKRRKNYKRTKGHRQHFTELKIQAN